MEITGNTGLLAVLGNPIKHSLSPKIHNYLSDRLGRNYVYVAFEIPDVTKAIESVRTLGISGVNVTSPFKEKAAQCVDFTDDEARAVGSVNTIVNKDGKLYGYSTDGEGLYRALMYENINVERKNVLVIGAGGAARATLAMLGRRDAARIVIKNRTEVKAKQLCESFNKFYNCEKYFLYSEPEKFDIVINTTSVGMGSCDCPVDDEKIFDWAEAAVDLIYYPRQTEFLKIADEKGIKTVNGLGMLAFQGVLAYELFTGEEVPHKLWRKVLELIDE